MNQRLMLIPMVIKIVTRWIATLVTKRQTLITTLVTTVTKVIPTHTSRIIFIVTHPPVGEWGTMHFTSNFVQALMQEDRSTKLNTTFKHTLRDCFEQHAEWFTSGNVQAIERRAQSNETNSR